MAVQPLTLGPQMIAASIAPFVGFEGVTQAFGRGAVLVEDNAQLDEAAADPVTGIVGISADSATGTTGAECPFYPALEGVIFEANLATGGANPPTDHVLVVGDFLTRYALQLDTSQTPDVWYIDFADTTALSVTIIGFRSAVGASFGRVYFVIHADVTVYAT